MRALIALLIGFSALPAMAQGVPITVGFGPSYPNHFMEAGAPAGLLFDVGDAALRDAGYAPDYVELPWARLYADIGDGDIDAAIGVFAVGEDRKKALYSNPIMTQYPVLVARKGEMERPKRLEDLHGRTLGGRLGLSYNTLIQHPEIHILRSRVDANNIQKLLRGRIDAAIVGSVTGLFDLRRDGHLDELEVIASIDEIPLGLALADERFGPQDLAAVNRALDDILASRALIRAAERYNVTAFLEAPPLIR